MTPYEEAVFERKAEKHFKSHREIPNGRDFRFNCREGYIDDPERSKKFNKNFDTIFPNAPGAGF